MPTGRQIIEFAFNNNPGDLVQDYGDCTPWLREPMGGGGVSMTMTRGRQQELQKHNAGRVNFVLDNRHRTFDPNTHPGVVQSDKRVRFRTEYPWLPGLLVNGGFDLQVASLDPWVLFPSFAAAAQVFTPDKTNPNLTLVADAGGGSASFTLVGTGTTGVLARSEPIHLPAGPMGFTYFYGLTGSLATPGSEPGNVMLGGATIPGTVVTGATIAVSCRARQSVVDGAIFSLKVNWYSDLAATTLMSATTVTFDALDVTWQRFGGLADAPPGAIAARVEFGYANSVAGHVVRIDSVVFDGPCSFEGIFPDIVGFIDSLDEDANIGDSIVNGQATDAFKLLSYAPVNGALDYVALVTADGASHLWTMSDVWGLVPGDTGVSKDVIGGMDGIWRTLFDSPPGPPPTPGKPGPFGALFYTCIDASTGVSSGPGMSSGQNYMVTHRPLLVDPTGVASPAMDFWWRYRFPGGLFGLDGELPDPGMSGVSQGSCLVGQLSQFWPYVQNDWYCEVTPGGVLATTATARFVKGYGATYTSHGTVNILDGNWHHIACCPVMGDPTSVDTYIDGVWVWRVSATCTDEGGHGDSFFVAAQRLATSIYAPAGRFYEDGAEWAMVAFYSGGLTPVQAQAHARFGNLFPVQPSGDRIEAILDTIEFGEIGVKVGVDRNIDDGTSLVSALITNVNSANALQYLQTVESSEYGSLFVDKSGAIRFKDRHAAQFGDGATVQGTFGMGAGEIPYSKVVPRFDDAYVINFVPVSTLAVIGGPAGTQQVAQDTASIQEFFVRQPTATFTGLVLQSDDDALQLGYWIIDHYKTQQQRVEQLTVTPLNNDAMWAMCTKLEIGDRVQVNVKFPGGGVVTYVVQIQGIKKTVRRGLMTWDFLLGGAETKLYMIFDDAVRGVMDSPYAMAY